MRFGRVEVAGDDRGEMLVGEEFGEEVGYGQAG